MATIRQEITFGAKWRVGTPLESAASGSTTTSTEIIQLDTTQYVSPTYYFEIVADTSVSLSNTVTLRRKGTSTDDATCTIPLLTTVPTLIRSSSFSPPAGQTEYVFFINSAVGGTTNVLSARIIVIDTGTITKTETQIEIGCAHGSPTSSTTFGVISNPKYWKYTSANWDGTITAFWEVVLNSGSTKATATAELQVADGTGDGFAGFAAVGSDLTSAAGVADRKRSASITLTAGRNYRVVYKTSSTKSGIQGINAKIIIDQTSSPTNFEPQYALTTYLADSGTALQAQLTKWDSTEWSGVTNTYTFCLDAADNSASDGELDTAGGTTVTGSTVTNPDNQGFSSAMTMPADGNLDFKLTTNNIDINAARIIVAVVVNAATVNVDQWYREAVHPVFPTRGLALY